VLLRQRAERDDIARWEFSTREHREPEIAEAGIECKTGVVASRTHPIVAGICAVPGLAHWFRKLRQPVRPGNMPGMKILDDLQGIQAALRAAESALEIDEVPVGCVIVHEGQIIGRGYNQVESLKDATAHAEILAIGAASNALQSWRLEDCTLYVTLEPCAMCAGAIILSRIPRLVYGATDPKAGACGSVLDVIHEPRLNHRVEVTAGILAGECGDLLREFFRRRRASNPT